jgi:hypothetical protein
MKHLGSIVTMIVAACAPSAAAAAYCAGADKSLPNYHPDYYAAPKEFGRSKFVVEAVVTNETWLGRDGKPTPVTAPFGSGDKRPWGLAAPYVGAQYDVRITRSFKGQPSTHVRLFSENSTARFWLNKGERYLLFISDEMFDEPIRQAMTIDTCGNSAKFNRALAGQLEALAARR